MKRSFGQEGISLLEVLLSLSIIAIILVMATKYFFLASNNDRVNVLRQQVGSIISAVHNWKGQNPQYSDKLTIQTLSDEGFLAESKYLAAGSDGSGLQMFSPWGKPIQFQASAEGVELSVSLPTNGECDQLQNSYPAAKCQKGSGKGPATFVLAVE